MFHFNRKRKFSPSLSDSGKHEGLFYPDVPTCKGSHTAVQVRNATILGDIIHLDREVTSFPMSSNILKYLSIVTKKLFTTRIKLTLNSVTLTYSD